MVESMPSQVHWPHFIADDIQGCVDELKRQQARGRIRYYGVCNFGPSNLQEFIKAGGAPVTNQVCYSPLAINRRSTNGVGVYYKMVTDLQTNANRSCNKNTPKARGVQIKHGFEAVIYYMMFSNICIRL